MNKPKGRRPKRIAIWLKANGEEFWPCIVCEKCGGWVNGIDHFAPYHTEKNHCNECDE